MAKLRRNIKSIGEGDFLETFDLRERELWEKVKPYLNGCHLRKDSPQEVIEADAELHRIAWDPDRMQ